MLDALSRAGQILIGVGKSGDLFDGRGFTRTVTAGSWTEALDDVIGMLNRVPRGLIYAACDVLAPSPGASAAALQEFDSRLSKLLEQLRSGDLFVLTADHGRDVTRNRTRPTREYVPLLVTGPKLAQGVDLGIRPSAADLGQTIVEALRGEPLPAGESFLDALRTG
jgi:phosphopentomutase